MAKAGPLNRLLRRVRGVEDRRRRPFATSWWVAFAGVVGALSAVQQLSGFPLTLGTSLSALAGSAAVAAYLARRRTRPVHLPVGPLAPLSERPLLVCPCGEDDARAANTLTRPFYGDEALPFERYRTWLARNPNILVCLQDRAGEIQGYFDILPFEEDFFTAFLEGKKTEQDIEASDLLPPQRSRAARRLYLAGIAVRDPLKHRHQRHASFLVWGLVEYLRDFFDPDHRREIYALAATAEGEALLRRFCFSIVGRAAGRRDHHNLYRMPGGPNDVKRLARRVPDWSGQCELSWRRAPGD